MWKYILEVIYIYIKFFYSFNIGYIFFPQPWISVDIIISMGLYKFLFRDILFFFVCFLFINYFCFILLCWWFFFFMYNLHLMMYIYLMHLLHSLLILDSNTCNFKWTTWKFITVHHVNCSIVAGHLNT